MYSYTHILESLSAEEAASATENQPGIANSGSTRRFTGAFLSSSSTNYEAGTQSPPQSSSESAGGTTSYLSGTYPRSVSSIAVSWTTTLRGNLNSTAEYESSGSSTYSIGPQGSSTGLDQWTYSLPATHTHAVTSYWTGSLGVSTTQISASAAATRTTTGSVSASASGTTLVPLFALDRATVRRWQAQRQSPPALRRPALAFAWTGDSSGVVVSISAGSASYLTDLEIGTSSSSDGFTAGTTFPGTFIADNSYTFYTGKSLSSTASRVPDISAARRTAQGVVLGSSWGSELSATPPMATGSLAAPIGSGLSSLSIWTRPVVMSGTTLCWSWQSSSWVLHGTSLSGSSASTYTVLVTPSGSLATGTTEAHTVIGLTTALLGPIIPVTVDSLHVLTISTMTSLSGVQAIYTSALSNAAGSALQTFASSSSQESSIGSGTAFPLSFFSSQLRWAAKIPVFSAGTSTWGHNDSSAGQEIPSLYSADKWNEAGRGDQVSVIE